MDDENLIEDILVFGEDDKICAEVYPNLQYADAIGVDDLETAVWDIIQKHNQNLESYKRILQCSVRYTPFEKTSSKKIIRGKYFEQRKKQKEEAVHFKKAENETQQAIFNSVAKCLGHQKFGIDMDLYEVGLDSLGSILLLTSLYEKVGLSISLQELSENPTVEKLEILAGQANQTKEYEIKETYPLTRLQQYFGYVIKGNTTSVLQGMLTETYVSRLKYSIPEKYRPLHFHIEAGKLNGEAGYELVPNVAPETMVKVYVFDKKYLKKPFGGWGDLYVMDYPTTDFIDQMQSPYEDSILYKTGRTARISLAGNVEFLEDAG